MNHKAKQCRGRQVSKAAVSATMAALCLSPMAFAPSVNAAPAPTPVSVPAARAITGTVVDATGEPVIGATVRVVGTNIAVMTNMDGKFSVQADNGATIEVTYIGMKTQTFKVAPGKDVYDLTLSEDANTLDEVVVVGYGQQKKVNLTGSVAAVNMDKIAETRPIDNVGHALAGMAAGVSVTSANNQPGDNNATIRVRGVGTISDAGSSPLVIIDGVEAGIGSVNPQDIETMSVLKDAASAAIYGSRAANGVILITTKQGKAGSVKVNYNGYVSFESIRKTLTPVSNYADYMELVNEGYENSYGSKNYIFSDAVIQEWRDNSNDPLRYPNQDWIDATFNNATATNHVLSVSGGTEKVRFYTSFGFNYNPGVMPRAAHRRYNGRISVDADPTKWLNIGANVSGYVGFTEAGAWAQNDIFTYSSATTPGMVFLSPDGRFGAMNNSEDDGQCSVNNPISRAYRTDGGTDTNNYRTRFFGTIKPFKGFSITGSYTYSYQDSEQRQKPHFVQGWNFKDDVVTYDNTSTTRVYYADYKTLRNFWDAVARYENKFWDRLQINAMVGMSSEQYKYKYFTANRRDLVDLSLWGIDAATGESTTTGRTSRDWSMQSYFGRINLNWEDKYLLEVNMRFDGSSRFRDGHRWGHFPSASFGWRMEQEPFMQGLVDKGLNALKPRVSYGKLGNNSIGDFEALDLYSLSNYILNNSVATGLAQTSIANPIVTWESTSVFNIGADLALFNSRFNATAEYFYKKTDNILIDLPAPYVHGTSSLPKVNSAEVSNKGFEITASWNDRIGNVNYGISANATYVKNNVDKYKGKGEDGRTITSNRLIWEGHPIYAHYLLKVDRIIQTDEDLALVQSMIDNAPIDESTGKQANPFATYGTPQKGDFLYQDVNGDGLINADDRAIVSDGTTPKWTLGMNLTAEWKGIDLAVLFQASLGHKTYFKSAAYNTPTVRYGYQLNKEVCEGRWYEGRTDATYPRLLFYQDEINTQDSDFYLQNSSYLKIRNIQLGYTLPKRWTSACQIDRVRIYGALENFITFTKFKGFDPEVSGMKYPTMRKATVGLNVTF